MDYKVDFGVNIKFMDKDGTQIFHEGDNVVCYVGDGNAYVGKITEIGTCRQDNNSEPERVICLDTSKGKTSYSCEIIRTEDITYICRYPLCGDNGFPDVEKAEFCIEVTNKWYDISVKTFGVLSGIYNEAIANSMTDIPEFGDVLALITENMENVLNKEKIVKIIRGTKESVAQ